MSKSYPMFKAAACHVAPIFLDTARTVDKTLSLIEEAADNGASLVAFPESFVPSLSGSLPLMMPGGSNHRCRDFYTWELRRGQPIQERS
jgi:hypothetical protein